MSENLSWHKAIGDVTATIKQLQAENERLKAELAHAMSGWELAVQQHSRLHEELTSLRTQQAAVPTWQPIETAPNDGTEILAYDCGEAAYCFARRVHPYLLKPKWVDSNDESILPTHWMPLPAAPEAPQPSQQTEPFGYVRQTTQGEWKFAKQTSWECWTPVYAHPSEDARQMLHDEYQAGYAAGCNAAMQKGTKQHV